MDVNKSRPRQVLREEGFYLPRSFRFFHDDVVKMSGKECLKQSYCISSYTCVIYTNVKLKKSEPIDKNSLVTVHECYEVRVMNVIIKLITSIRLRIPTRNVLKSGVVEQIYNGFQPNLRCWGRGFGDKMLGAECWQLSKSVRPTQ